MRSEWALASIRLGVAALDRDASAMNQAFGMSEGRPTGIPAMVGVSVKGWRGSSNSGAVQLMQGYPPRVQDPLPFQGRMLQSPWAWVPTQPRCSIMQPSSDSSRALALYS